VRELQWLPCKLLWGLPVRVCTVQSVCTLCLRLSCTLGFGLETLECAGGSVPCSLVRALSAMRAAACVWCVCLAASWFVLVAWHICCYGTTRRAGPAALAGGSAGPLKRTAFTVKAYCYIVGTSGTWQMISTHAASCAVQLNFARQQLAVRFEVVFQHRVSTASWQSS
jgi:hypothetical protein